MGAGITTEKKLARALPRNMFRTHNRHNKKEQDVSCSDIQRGQKGKKKSSVLIQLSGWLRTLDMVWLTGLLICALFFIVAYWKCYRVFRMSLPVENEVTSCWLNSHRLRRNVSIRQSDCISSPLTFGIFRPVILRDGFDPDGRNTKQFCTFLQSFQQK